jgi:hypothetical protein
VFQIFSVFVAVLAAALLSLGDPVHQEPPSPPASKFPLVDDRRGFCDMVRATNFWVVYQLKRKCDTDVEVDTENDRVCVRDPENSSVLVEATCRPLWEVRAHMDVHNLVLRSKSGSRSSASAASTQPTPGTLFTRYIH